MSFKDNKVFFGTLILLVILSAFVDHILIGPNNYVSILVPSTGVILTYHMFKKKYVSLTSFVTYFFSTLVFRLVVYSEIVSISLFISFYKTAVLLVMTLVFCLLTNTMKNHGYSYMNKRDIFNYVIIGIFVTFLGATLNIIPIFFIFNYETPAFWYGNTWVGYLFGFFIFGSSIKFSSLHDDPKITARSTIRNLVFLVTLFAVSYLLFSEVFPGIDFHHFSYLILVLYLLAALFLKFGVIVLANYLVYICYGYFYYNNQVELDLSSELFSIITVLIILTGASVFFRVSFVNIQNKEKESREAKDSMKNMMVSTNKILRNVKNIPNSSETYSNSFLINVFRMGSNAVSKFDKASLFVCDNDAVKYIDAIGYDLDTLNKLDLTVSEFSWAETVPSIINSKNELYAEKMLANKDFLRDYPKLKQAIRFSIFFNDTLVAGMSFDITEDSHEVFINEDLESYVELSELINSYYNLFLIQDSEELFKNDMVISLVRALGLYDSYTGQHSEEVAFLALKVSNILNLDSDRTNRIYWAAIVHDIGKIGVDPTILNKKGRLTQEERKQIEKHAEFGYSILNSTDNLKDVAKRVKYHHERWDGTGYPNGLIGDDIPLCSQVLAVCDAVSAMSRNRIYSKAKDIDEIIAELEKGRGNQFSPKVVDAMVQYIKESRLVEYFLRT